MQALVWTGPRQMEMQEVSKPEPAAGDVLLRVGAAGICGSELSGYLGTNSLRVPPLVMGHEFAGTVDVVGPGTLRLASGEEAQAGQRLVVNPLISCGECDLCQVGRPNLCRRRQLIGIQRPGGFAEFVAVPAAQCYLIPAQLSDCQAALAEPLACGMRALAQAQPAPDEPLVILGAGPIGLLSLVAARDAGIRRIIITDTSPERLKVAEQLGAAETFRADEVDVVAAVQRLTEGRGVTAAIDAVGLTATRQQAVRAVRPGGRAVFIGLHHETSELEANYLVRQEIEVVGAFAYLPDEFARALDLLARGALSGDGAWITELGLNKGADAFADLVAGRGGYVKIALIPAAVGR